MAKPYEKEESAEVIQGRGTTITFCLPAAFKSANEE